MATWLKRWEPEDPQFWKSEGSGRAWLTLSITTFNLFLSFATWFVMSAVAVRLPNIGFTPEKGFGTMQLFWLAAMPGLAAGILRTVHTFLIPIFGTRMTITVATFMKLIPMVWLGFAVQNPDTPFMHFLIIAFLCGFGGGDFSSHMPSTSIFFPKRLQGTAMGLQAGLGNLGVSVTQFVAPWIIGFSVIALAGVPQTFVKKGPVFDIKITKDAGIVKDVVVKNEKLATVVTVVKNPAGVVDLVLAESEMTKGMKVDIVKNEAGVITDIAVVKTITKPMWLQNASYWFIPLLIIGGLLSWFLLKSIPMKKVSIGGMLKDMTDNKHAYFCTWIYIMTFGAFSGFAGTFPLMIKILYGNIPGMDPALAPDPLKYAFLGPLVGSVVRFAGGPLSDRFGGAVFTMISGIGIVVGCIALVTGGYLAPVNLDQFPMFVYLMLFVFLMAGIGNFSTFRQFPIAFAFSPRKGAQILGWTGAWAAYGPFVFASLIGSCITKYHTAAHFFVGVAIFCFIGTILNYWFYYRSGAERGDWGVGNTWWTKLSESERQRYISENP